MGIFIEVYRYASKPGVSISSVRQVGKDEEEYLQKAVEAEIAADQAIAEAHSWEEKAQVRPKMIELSIA